ncbi:hypothetical protein V7122_19355 [Bacillus sp. JJ1532]|uniref:hypothetical protein n=1 Tax=Bacillus sp. JJ1532 TaxID=3122958 RepID=UPI002FFE37E5
MKIVPNDYCNECRRNTHLIVTGETEDSIFATCPHCKAKFDLINDGYRIKEVKKVKLVTERISYYTRKVAEHSKTYRDINRYQYRSQRLLYYKSLMHGNIKKEGYK